MDDTPVAAPPAAPPSTTGERDYYSIAQAAALLGVSRVSIWRWVRAGRLTASRLGHRTTRIRREELERFLGAGAGVRPPDVGGDGHGDGAAAAPRADWRDLEASRHFVQFYEADAALVDAVAGFIGASLRAGDVGVVLATAAHRAGIEDRLAAYGLDPAAARAEGRYVARDAADLLARIMVDGAPEPARCAEVLGGVVARAAGGGRRVRVFGELVALLALDGNYAAAVRLEAFWNDLLRTHDFALFCAYPLACLQGAAQADALGAVCAAHAGVIPAESYTALPTPDDRLRAIAALQQRAASLAGEVARRRAADALLAGQKRVLELIATGAALADALVALVRVIEAHDDGLLCSVLVRDPEREQFCLGVAPSLPDSYGGALATAPIAPPYLGPCGRAAHLGEEVVTADVAGDGRWAAEWRQLALGHGLRTCYSAPIFAADGAVLGSFAMYYREPRDPRPANARLVETATHLAGIAIARARAEAERARLLAREQAARARAEDAVRARDEFLATVSHDLKSPLSTVKGYAQLLRMRARREVTPEIMAGVADGAAKIEATADKMTALIGELLDVARLEAGESLDLERAPTDLVALAAEAIAGHRQAGADRRFDLLAPDAPLTGTWDRARLERALNNLLGNAVKYSPDGGPITMSVRQERDDAGAWAVLAVRDEGIGIPAAELPRVFERYRRASNAAGRIAGTGLGLASARHIVESHGGALTVESREGRGSTFTMRLPLASDE